MTGSVIAPFRMRFQPKSGGRLYTRASAVGDGMQRSSAHWIMKMASRAMIRPTLDRT
jgi:hypothetical protein